MQKAIEYIMNNFQELRAVPASFKNIRGEEIKYNKLYLIVDLDGLERAYEFRLTDDAKAIARADATTHEVAVKLK